MICRFDTLFRRKANKKTTILLLLSVVFFFGLYAPAASAQKRFSKNYAAGRSVRLQLTNRTGTVTVEGWNRPQINVSAYLESPAARIDPQVVGDTLFINLVKDNPGANIGNVNFTIRVPYYSAVDIETRIGNLSVSNVSGGLVRAHISSEGDITLTNIGSPKVAAENVIGDIFFDGEIQDGGNYRFLSMKGNINLRIPLNSSFQMIATAPSTRDISLGAFSNGSINLLANGRRIVGRFGSGSAALQVTNQRGSIAFLTR
jgi:DUF4097 and DUF4098 domain-containing protein YvlB